MNACRLLSGMFLLVISLTACKKQEEPYCPESNSFVVQELASCITPQPPSGLCYQKTVPLCSDGITVGSVEVARGNDQKVYFTYQTLAGWYLAMAKVFAGLRYGGITTATSFTSTKQISYPFTQRYVLALTNLPDSIEVVACAVVARKTSGGTITAIKTAWGDGCSGRRISEPSNSVATIQPALNGCVPVCSRQDMAGGYVFSYKGGACGSAPAGDAAKEPNICSQETINFFGVHPDYGMELPWTEPTVTVGSFTYTEAEARAISKATDPGAYQKNAKHAFVLAATLILSHTDYPASPTVGPAMKIVIDWLTTLGKLSPLNLPQTTAVINEKINFLENWISGHLCTGR